jgi:hypothetical protein
MPLHLARVVLVVWVFSIERKKYRAGIRPQFVENPENPDMALK